MGDLAGAIVKSMTAHKRKPSDFYPTPPEATWALIPRLKLEPGAFIREPACGDGAMARVLKAAGFYVEASDIRYTGYGEPYRDFLAEEDPEWADALITNPPFSLAEAFIRKAVPSYPVVALLLKSNYWHTQGRVKLWDEYPPTAAYPVTWRLAFLADERGNSPLMDCTWFVWQFERPPLDRPMPRPVDCPKLLPLVSVALCNLARALEENAEARRGGEA